MQPSRDQFRALAREHSVVPVWRDLLADLITPVAAFARLTAAGEPGFLLESVEHGERWSRWSFVGRRPALTLTARRRRITTDAPLPPGVPVDAGVLAAVEALLDRYRSPRLDGLPPLHGGLLGYLGYDVVREVEHLPTVPDDDLGLPDAVLSIIGELAAFDHWRQQVTVIANAFIPPDATDDDLDRVYEDALARLDQLVADGARPLEEPLLDPPDPDDPLPEVRSNMGPALYRQAVEVAREHIFAGDIFQAVLAQRFDFDLDADPFDVYRVLRQVNPSPYMYFVRQPELSLVGSSPEPMVQLLDGRVISRPIAGTRRRGRSDEEDRLMGAELSEHPKEIAEHVMLVDLARNDVGRVVRFGTEQVDEMMTLERYSHVMHLTSQVSGELAEGRTPIDVLRATLPAGTVSGAPKVRAMEIIDALEATKRGPYAGVVGYLDFSGNIDTAIAIRTMVCLPDGRASVSAGAGIVADSVPEHEDLECHNKARALLVAVPAARRMSERRERIGSHGASAAPPAGALSAIDLRRQLGAVAVERDVLRASGPEAVAFLQGQLSQEVTALPVGDSAWSLLLQPQGKVDAWLRITRTAADEVVLDVDGGHGDAVRARLERFKLRTRCDIEPLDWSCVALRGPGAAALAETGTAVAAPAAWPGVEGVDLLGPGVTAPPEVPAVDQAGYEALRIEAGVPRMGAELGPDTIPAEAGPWLVEVSVDFTKGCFTGQELVARIHSRGGNVPRRLRGLVIDGDAVPPAGASVLDGDGEGDKAVGAVTSAAASPGLGSPIALASLGRAVSPPARVTVAWDGARSAAEALELPLVR